MVSNSIAGYCVVGFSARAVSRKTPIYLLFNFILSPEIFPTILFTLTNFSRVSVTIAESKNNQSDAFSERNFHPNSTGFFFILKPANSAQKKRTKKQGQKDKDENTEYSLVIAQKKYDPQTFCPLIHNIFGGFGNWEC